MSVFSRLRLFAPRFLPVCAVLAFAVPVRAEENAPTRAEVSGKRTDLKELRGQIEVLRKEMATTQTQHTSAADQVRDVESEISTTQRELYLLAGQRSHLQTTLKKLATEAQYLERQLDDARARLEKLLVRQYLQGSHDAFSLILNGRDANQSARDLYYLGTLGAARQQLLDETQTLLERKQVTSGKMREREQELTSVEAQQKEQHVRLLAQREQRRQVLSRISSRISQQRKEIGQLQRDEKQLTQLITRLEKIIAQNARRARTPVRADAPELFNEHTPEELPAGNFATQKGRLRLPVAGMLTNRFGSARQEGSAWKGLFIRAPQGSQVKAIAPGRVVFADWLRGFGNLLIIDHGDNYLSIYGYNDAILKQVGDAVRAGDSVAASGNSGGNPESGLYFELRYHGQPVDPLQWVRLD